MIIDAGLCCPDARVGVSALAQNGEREPDLDLSREFRPLLDGCSADWRATSNRWSINSSDLLGCSG